MVNSDTLPVPHKIFLCKYFFGGYFTGYWLPKPSQEEQQQIVNYLDDKCSKIDVAIQKQEQAIAKLEEYRKSVIYYAVTGKIDCGKAV